MELEKTSSPFSPVPDRRPHIPEPPPVSLVAVADVELATVAGLEREMDALYVGGLGFEREPGEHLIYRAENFRLRFRTLERPEAREDLRPVGVTVSSLAVLREKLDGMEIEYVRQRGLGPGEETVLFRDPAGNWLEVGEATRLG